MVILYCFRFIILDVGFFCGKIISNAKFFIFWFAHKIILMSHYHFMTGTVKQRIVRSFNNLSFNTSSFTDTSGPDASRDNADFRKDNKQGEVYKQPDGGTNSRVQTTEGSVNKFIMIVLNNVKEVTEILLYCGFHGCS